MAHLGDVVDIDELARRCRDRRRRAVPGVATASGHRRSPCSSASSPSAPTPSGSPPSQGSTRSAWAVIGGVLVVVAIGAPLLAAWRLRRIRRHSPAARRGRAHPAHAERRGRAGGHRDRRGPARTAGPASPAVDRPDGPVHQAAARSPSRPPTCGRCRGALRSMTTFPALIVVVRPPAAGPRSASSSCSPGVRRRSASSAADLGLRRRG